MPGLRAKTATLSRWLTLLSVLALTACSATPHIAAARPPATASASTLPAPATISPPAPATTPAIAATHGPCPRTPQFGGSSSGFPEQQGVAVDATLWALFFGDEVVAGQEIKVVGG